MANFHVRQTECRLAALRLEQCLGRDSIRNCKSSKVDRSSIGHRNREVRHGQRGSLEVLRSLGVRRNLGVHRQEGSQLRQVSSFLTERKTHQHVRGPPTGGPPLPPKPGGGPPKPGGPPAKGAPKPGPGPPTPAAGPVRPTGSPRPAGRATPGPAARVAAVEDPPVAPPSRAAGSAGGGPSTDSEMTVAPRMMVRPMARRSSVSVTCEAAPGAALPFRRVRRNSSVSARTRFMCYGGQQAQAGARQRNGSRLTLSKASICPTIWRPS